MADILRELSWIDVFVVVVLVAGVFIGWTGGFLRYALSGLGVLVAFVLASQLKRPVSDLLTFWTAFGPELRELWVYLVLFVGLSVAAWFIIRAIYGRTRLPVARQLDELGGAVLGLIFVVLLLVFLLVAMDTFFRDTSLSAETQQEAGPLIGLYDAMNGSWLVGVLRENVIPLVGYITRPFVPREVAQYLRGS